MKQCCNHPHEAAFSEFIQEGYGKPEGLATILDAGIKILFYVEEETFDRKDIQNVVSALRGINAVLRKGDSTP